MKHALRIVSLVTLVVLGAAIIGQALVVMIGVAYTPDGIPLDPTPQAQVAGGLASFGSLFGMPLAVATFTLGLVAMAQARHFGWLVATVGAAALVGVGLIGMAWILLGEGASNPLAFQTPLVVIPLVTLLYGFVSAPRRVGISTQ